MRCGSGSIFFQSFIVLTYRKALFLSFANVLFLSTGLRESAITETSANLSTVLVANCNDLGKTCIYLDSTQPKQNETMCRLTSYDVTDFAPT